MIWLNTFYLYFYLLPRFVYSTCSRRYLIDLPIPKSSIRLFVLLEIKAVIEVEVEAEVDAGCFMFAFM